MTQRRQILKLVAAGFAPALALRGDDKIGNTIFTAGKATLTREAFGDLRIYFNGPTDQLKRMTAGSLALKAAMTPHAPHQHPEEEIMLITEGEGEIFVDGKTTRVGPGSMMYCAAGRLHGITAGPKPLMFYFYKWIAR